MACEIKARIHPGSKVFSVKGFDEWRNCWIIRVKSIARKNAANNELLSNLSGLGLQAEIISGIHSEEKIIKVNNLNERETEKILKSASFSRKSFS